MTGCCFPVTLDRSRSRRGSSKLCISSSKHRRKENYKGPLIVCFGEMMMNLVPTVLPMSLAEATTYKKFPSGATANVAVGISRLGVSAAFIGKVGNDEFGHLLSDILKQNGVDSSGLLFDDDARTALAFYALKSNGEPEFMFYRNPSADMLLRPQEIDLSLIKKEPVLVLELVLDQHPRNYLEGAHGIVLGDDPYDDKVIMMKLYHYNLKLLIVTEGGRGCRYYTKDFKGRLAGFKVEVVDTTGAGDSFVAGLLSIVAAHNHIYKDEKRLREALDFANACGAVTVTRRGAIPSLPTKDVVLRLLFSCFNS
ncbi:hypothetical protein V8G54_020305 [Vigna mungo]|uniref:Carbohydrate kinase PfkB domain-containing protein n=1 Tax=Vigna mungo TaxID=3915 RepID=A0AAQ3NBL5_VIGMU